MAKVVPIESTAKTTSKPETRLKVSRFSRSHVFPRVVLFGLGFFYLLPFYWMLVNAFKSNKELRVQPPTWYPHHLEWANFQRAINVMDFWLLLRNSTFYTFFVVVG